MIQITVSKGPVPELIAEGYVLFCAADQELTPEQRAGLVTFNGAAEQVLKRLDFSGAPETAVDLQGVQGGRPVSLILVGIGSLSAPVYHRIENMRRACGKAIRAAEKLKITQLVFKLPHPELIGFTPFDYAKELAVAIEMAAYQFNQFITDTKRHVAKDYAITFVAPSAIHEALEFGIETGTRIGCAVNQARHWCDLPALYLTPTALAERAEAIAHAHDSLACTIFGKNEIVEMGMGGLIAVSQGSAQEPRFIVMEYHCGQQDAQTVGLVGKGVTFDSGGLSIKPASRMDEMKDDMAGAAAVIATMQALAYLRPHVNVVACAPVTENLPSGTAIKPGDIVYHYNGKTSEIKNTDAEGRLILADALSYIAAKYKLDALIDIATLTGACSHALGPFYAAVLGKNEPLIDRLIEAGKMSGDRLWPLPFSDDYRPAIRSEVADVCNIGRESYRAGAITAGFFLEHFASGMPWAHLDIAGTSFEVPDRPYYRGGSTGFGVRLFVEFLMDWKPL
ncbi:TPA: leucyl aminopeptidase [Candidatus Dependentiae bacterium]|nr:MAG: putative cytosol aminopeptidase [candidate division TM6 bacterium GW2011_GWF2_43_87]HBL98750.1 leucyl aminopeptidase [Candidatus Dependentiae bacterium]